MDILRWEAAQAGRSTPAPSRTALTCSTEAGHEAHRLRPHPAGRRHGCRAGLAGCASISPDGLRGAVQSHTASRLPDGAELPPTDLQARDAAQQRIDEWLRQPLDMDQSVRIALLNNPGLQARLAQLGVQDADRVQALTLPNPTLTLGRMVNSDEREIERQLSFGLVSLITLPWRSRWQGMQMEQATLTAAQDVLRLAADTRRAWLRAVATPAAGVQRAHARGGRGRCRAGAAHGPRGNFSRLQQARELSIQQDTAAQLARARLAATAEHEQLARLMGLWGRRIDFKLPDQLPAIPQAATQLRAGDDAEATRCASAWTCAPCAATWTIWASAGAGRAPAPSSATSAWATAATPPRTGPPATAM